MGHCAIAEVRFAFYLLLYNNRNATTEIIDPAIEFSYIILLNIRSITSFVPPYWQNFVWGEEVKLIYKPCRS
jgi:hypothetical protein